MERLQADEYCITAKTISQITVGYRFDVQEAPRVSTSPSRGKADGNTIIAAGALDDSSPAISQKVVGKAFSRCVGGEQFSVVHPDLQAFCVSTPSHAMRTIP